MRKMPILWLLFVATPWAASGEAIAANSHAAGGRRVAVDAALESTSSPAGVRTPSGFVLSFRISPDSRYAVYGSPAAIYSRRLPNGPAVQLAPPDSCSGMSDRFLITDDSATVLFTCWGAVNTLWAVPIGGPPASAVELSLPPDLPYQLNDFFASTSGSRIFYTLPRSDPFRVGLYSVPVTGPAAASVAVSSPLAEGDQVWAPFPLQLSPHVVYSIHRPWSEHTGIWRSGVAIANPVLIGDSPASHPMAGGFVVSPDEQTLVWAASDEFEDYALYSAPISDPPGTAVQLNADVPFSSVSGYVVVSPDSTRVAFVSDQEGAQFDLFSLPIYGPSSAAVNLSGYEPSWYPELSGIQFSPDSAWVIYLGNREVFGRKDLYAVPAAGPAGARVRINPVDPASEGVSWFEVIPGTSELLFPLSVSTPEGASWCYRGSWLGGTGNAAPLWAEPLPYQHMSCHWLDEGQSVLVATENPSTQSSALWLAQGEGVPDLKPKKLLDSAQFEPHASPFTYGDLEASPDGRFVVYLGQPIGGDLGLGVLPMPFFWDGFESAGTSHWSSTFP